MLLAWLSDAWDLAENERELVALAEECDHVFVGGLSMGGTLTLRLAEEHPGLVRGIVVVNPSVHSRRSDLKALPLLRHVVPAVPGIGTESTSSDVGWRAAPTSCELLEEQLPPAEVG